MKTDRRISASIRTAAVLLAGLLAVGHPADGQITFNFQLGRSTAREDPSKALSQALADKTREVKNAFDKNRRALRTVSGPDGGPAYFLQDVKALITRTGTDLDQAIESVRPQKMGPLQAWVTEKMQDAQDQLAQPRQARFPGPWTPRAVTRIASLGGAGSLRLASVTTAAPQQETVSAGTVDRLLDQVGNVIGQILSLAERNDLEVELWVGSTPGQKAMFSFWAQGRIKGSKLEPLVIRTDGTRNKVLRGFYIYKAAWTKGAVTELIKYPNQAGAPLASERLDLVNGTSFFCCRFDEQFCQHVASKNECRP